MRINCFKPVALFLTFILLFLASWVTDSNILAASSDSTVLQAKKDAEAKGYTFFTTHDEIVAMAKKEGELRVMSGLSSANFKPLINAFKQKYPFFTDIRMQEITGTEAYQRTLLEIKVGQTKEWDVAHLPIDFAQECMPYIMKCDILGMATHGVLKIDPRMVHSSERDVISVVSTVKVVPYNRKLISEDKVPAKWEDFLKPEFKGKKFVLDIRPIEVSSLVPAWGLERTVDFARKLAAQQPVWARGATRYTQSIMAGEYSFAASVNFSTLKRLMSKDPTGTLAYKILEPVPTRLIDDSNGIINKAVHPHAALLWLEFIASPEGQEIIDKNELEASMYTPGTVNEQAVRGKKLSVVGWDHFSKFAEYESKINEAYGFPKGDK